METFDTWLFFDEFHIGHCLIKVIVEFQNVSPVTTIHSVKSCISALKHASKLKLSMFVLIKGLNSISDLFTCSKCFNIWSEHVSKLWSISGKLNLGFVFIRHTNYTCPYSLLTSYSPFY